MPFLPETDLVAFFGRQAEEVARDIIGYSLYYERPGVSRKGGIITEVEAYTSTDPSSHTFKGKNHRNEAMYGPPGTVYIYFIYGMHYCLNFVTGKNDGQAILLRSLEPIEGLDDMTRRRKVHTKQDLCNGPAKLVEAFGVTPDQNGLFISEAGFRLSPPLKQASVARAPRIGISKASEVLWNFFDPTSGFTSFSTKRKKIHR